MRISDWSSDVCSSDLLRHQPARNAKPAENFIVPILSTDVEKQRTRRIGGIGHMGLAARELVDQPRVYGAETQLALLRPRAHLAHCRATMRVWCRRNRDRAAAPSSSGRWAPCPRPSASRKGLPCADPARRWHCGAAFPWRDPTAPLSRADW